MAVRGLKTELGSIWRDGEERIGIVSICAENLLLETLTTPAEGADYLRAVGKQHAAHSEFVLLADWPCG